MKRTRAIVSLGSNVEPRADYLVRALDALGAFPKTRFVRASAVVETEPVDVPSEYRHLKFLNQVAIFETTLEPLDFSRRMHAVEDALGRVRTVRNGPRTIDLDLVDFGGKRLETPELVLPHPRARERAFVLEPLAELGVELKFKTPLSIGLKFEDAFAPFTVLGVDEAGRGPLAGGVYAAAVSVPLARAHELLAGDWRAVNDSKKLSAAKRDALAAAIRETQDCAWCVASASAAEIDELNILRATHLAMRRAAAGALAKLGRPAGECRILVDGLPVLDLPCPSRNVVKGDAQSLLVAAASILAKTARDADCLRLEREHPGYGFAVHKGYPTAAHLAALAKLGPCPEHRRSFGPVRKLLG